MIALNSDYLKTRFHYDAETGNLIWKNANARWVGKRAGCAHKSNRGKRYIRVLLDGSSVYAHRIIWAILHGEEPENIDHIDGDGLNNRADNLRSVSHAINLKNQKKHVTNTSGASGVSYRKDVNRWRARIMVDGKPISLGNYASFDDAVRARTEAERKHQFLSQQ
jgi:hypothetical protein